MVHLLPIATSVEHGRPLTCWSGQNPGTVGEAVPDGLGTAPRSPASCARVASAFFVGLAVFSTLVGAAVGGGGEHAFLGSLQAEGQ